MLAVGDRSLQHRCNSVNITLKLFSLCSTNSKKCLYLQPSKVASHRRGLQLSSMQQHVLLALMTLPLLAHLLMRVATNQSVMVKDTSCQTPNNHCFIVDGPRHYFVTHYFVLPTHALPTLVINNVFIIFTTVMS